MPEAIENVEVSKTEIETLRNARVLLGQLLDDPEQGLALKRKVKKIYPNVRFPELDLIDTVTKPYDDRLKATSDELAALKKQIADDKKAGEDSRAESTLRERLESVKTLYGFTEEGMQTVIKRMRDQNNPDVEAAAAYVNGLAPKPSPVKSSGLFPTKLNPFGAADLSDDPAIKKLHTDPMAFMEEEAIAVMDEFARGEAA